MKKIYKSLFKIFILAVTLLLISSPAHAEQQLPDYTMLAPLPYVTTDNCTGSSCQSNLSKYLPGAFKLAIYIAAFMAFVMLSYGGFTYMTTDAIGQKSAARGIIENAIYGLLLAIGAYIILYTINPKILDFSFLFPGSISTSEIQAPLTGPTAIPTPPPPPTGGYAMPSPPGTNPYLGQAANGGILPGYSLSKDLVAQNKSIVTNLLPNVTVNHDPCADGHTSGCTNVVLLPSSAINGVKQIAKDCNCIIMITGGTEGGHKTHGPYKAVVDLDASPSSVQLTNFLKTKLPGVNFSNLTDKQWLPQITLSNGSKATFMWELTGGIHWHVVFN